MAGQPMTRLQISGHRFVMRRMEHAMVRGDARMLDDPLRAQSISLAAGAVLAVAVVAFCAGMAYLRPAATLGDASVVMVRESGAMYVRLDDILHPVYNLASARLIAGAVAEPRLVGQRAVDAARRGPMIGIPGAPEHISPPLTGADGQWTVCDEPESGTTAIAGPLAYGVGPGPHMLVTPRGDSAAMTYLIYDGWRARVDLRHPAVVRALRLEGVAARPVSPVVLAAIPEAPAIVPPRIPSGGTAGPLGLPVGTIVRVPRAETADFYVTLPGGVQRIGEVAADLIRLTDSRVGQPVPTIAPDRIGMLPVVDTVPVRTFPERGGVTDHRFVCARWEPSTHSTVLAGDALPAPDGLVRLAQADGDGPALDAVAVPPGRSAYVRSVALTGPQRSQGPAFLVTDSGVRFGITAAADAAALGLPATATPAPWALLAALPAGPELNREAASVVRDGIAATP